MIGRCRELRLRAVGRSGSCCWTSRVLLTVKTCTASTRGRRASRCEPAKKQRRTLRVLALHAPGPRAADEASTASTRSEVDEWKTEYDVAPRLRALGHEVQPLGVQDELVPIRDAVEELEPHVVFNLLEEFHGNAQLRPPRRQLPRAAPRAATPGCNPRGLILARDKALSKKLLAYHRIRVAGASRVFPIGQGAPPAQARLPADREVPHRAGVARDRAGVARRRRRGAGRARRASSTSSSAPTRSPSSSSRGASSTSACSATERLTVLPVWELRFDNMPPGAPLIATARVKHDLEYQEKRGIAARRRSCRPVAAAHPAHARQRIYRILELTATRGSTTGWPRRDALLPRGEPQPRDRRERGVRLGRAGGGSSIRSCSSA